MERVDQVEPADNPEVEALKFKDRDAWNKAKLAEDKERNGEYTAELAKRCISFPYREKKYVFVQGNIFREMLQRCNKFKEFQRLREYLLTTEAILSGPADYQANLSYVRAMSVYGWFEGWNPEAAAVKTAEMLENGSFAGTKWACDPSKWEDMIRKTKTLDLPTPFPPWIPPIHRPEKLRDRLRDSPKKAAEQLDLDSDVLWAVRHLSMDEKRMKPHMAPSATAWAMWRNYRDQPKYLLEQAFRIQDEQRKIAAQQMDQNKEWVDDKRKQMSVIEKLING